MTLNEAICKLDALEAKLMAYRHAMGVLIYDGETAAPANSAPGRGATLAVLGGVEHEMLTAPETRELLDTLLDAREGLDLPTLRRAELLREDCEHLTLVPAGEYAAYQRLLAESGAAWRAAKAANDYAAFAPFLDRIIEYNRRLAQRKDASRPAYDVLLDMFEKDACMAALDPFFERLRAALTPVVAAVGEKPRPDAPFIHASFPVSQQRRLTKRLMAMMDIDPADCVVGETEHPFTDGYGKHDVRITTHYHERSAFSSMYSVIHEAGHALYEMGIADEYQGTRLAAGVSMGIHESQSRFYENLIGRSLPFCQAVLPLLQECFPGQTGGLNADTLYRLVNIAGPSLIRMEADELTYPMHVMVRYELEKGMISGDLKVADIPGAWNELYRKYLGVEVPDDARGCLQDSHWSGGTLGYFPSYALGSAYGAQMLRSMEREIDVWGSVARGDLKPVTGWLRARIHRFGSLLTPAQLLASACGAPFDPDCYIDYLTEKYTRLYAL